MAGDAPLKWRDQLPLPGEDAPPEWRAPGEDNVASREEYPMSVLSPSRFRRPDGRFAKGNPGGLGRGCNTDLGLEIEWVLRRLQELLWQNDLSRRVTELEKRLKK
jgi:hypothetical protein